MLERGLKVTRACFAVIVKLAGLTPKLESVIENLDLRSMDFDEEGPERIKQMKEVAVSELSKDTALLLKEWCNATKMRHWLKNVSEDDEIREGIVNDVVAKAEFLIKLVKPPHF